MLLNLFLWVKRTKTACFCAFKVYCMSDENNVLHASDGMSQSPLGERPTDPTFGPSGRHERLNCWLKKRLMNVLSHLIMVSSS